MARFEGFALSGSLIHILRQLGAKQTILKDLGRGKPIAEKRCAGSQSKHS